MNTKRKSNSVITVAVVDGKLLFDVLGAGQVTFDPAKASAACKAHAELHGWKQRLSDAAALSRDDETGKPASPADKLAAVKELAEYYESGAEEWSRVGAGGGGKSITIEAIAALKGVEYDQAEAIVADFAAKKYEGDTKKALAFLRQGERVAAKIEEIRKSRMPAPKVDADKALDEIVGQ